MKAAKQELEETLLRYNNMVNDVSKFKFNQRETELFTNMMQDYATEAIKADRERVVNIKIDHGDSFILPKYEKNCILNLPIELP